MKLAKLWLQQKREKYQQPSRGLGDTVEKVLKKAGVKPCKGCGRRRDKLNELFPYKEKV